MTLQQMKYALRVAQIGSINEAAKSLYISQPSLSNGIMELEKEIGLTIFRRTGRGMETTPEGQEFLRYISQVYEQYQLVSDKYLEQKNFKQKFNISSQHYSFAIKAFVELVKQFGVDEYEFGIFETRTYNIIEDVALNKSEIGIIYLSDFNEKIITKALRDNKLEFTQLLQCNAYAYMWKGHPLATRSTIEFEELQHYPCLMFDQGDNNSVFFSEEILCGYEFKRIIKACDRATLLNLMVGIDGFTVCSGIINEELNGDSYIAIPINTTEKMQIGYIKRKNVILSNLAEKYLEELKKYVSI